MTRAALDPDAFRPPTGVQRSAARRQFGLNDGHFVIAWTGRLAPEKNVSLLLEALACGGCVSDRLLIAGDGPCEPVLKQQAARLNIAGRVTFCGRHEDVRPILHAADAFVFPSTGEALGQSLIEAMACG